MEKNKETQQEEYLKQFLTTSEDVQEIKEDIKKFNSQNNVSSLEFINVDMNALPMSMFYKPGTQIKIRAAKVKEVQYYSVVDNSNIIDVQEKMNQMLSSCSRVILANGSQGSYKDIKDGDKLFLVFMIRELTFQKGSTLAKDIVCEHCQNEFKIPYRSTGNAEYPKTFEIYEMPEKLKKYFNPDIACFEFNINDKTHKLAPPTIGIQETFYSDIKSKVANKKLTNVSFLKIIPYMLPDKISITDDGIKAKEEEFVNWDMDTFQIINKAVDYMVFGLKGIKMNCPVCNGEVHTEVTFPEGAGSLFIIPNRYNFFTEE